MTEEQKKSIIEGGKEYFRPGCDKPGLKSRLVSLVGNASKFAGMDFEFIDALDGRRKYCQCLMEPSRIGMKETAAILRNFANMMRGVCLCDLPFSPDDLVVGVMFGSADELSGSYTIVQSHYHVYCGADFWEHITGERDFYSCMVNACGATD